jgi:uncharacterized membrane protein YphA (DoxX/SURF4 family)
LLQAAQIAAVIGRVVLGTLFLLAGARKLRARGDFELALRRYELLPAGWPRPVSWGLPLIEVVVGLLLLSGAAISVVAAAQAGLLLIFSAAMGVNLARGRTFDCGCSVAVAPRRISWRLVVHNGGLAICALLVAAASPRVAGVDAWLRGHSGALATSDAMGLVLATVAAMPAAALLSQAARLVSSTRQLASHREVSA